MKKIIISPILVAVICLLGTSCMKKDINGDSKNLISGSYITLDSVISENLDFSNPTATVAIKVGSKGSPVASVDIYVAKNADDSRDTTQWVKIKNVPYSDGVTLSVTTAELATALAPDAIAPGTSYTLQNVVNTKDGRKFSVLNTPDTYNSFPAYNMAITWSAIAVCPFDQAAAVGSYVVSYDGDWQDFSNGSPITVTAGPDSKTIEFYAYPSPAAGGTNRQPWIVKVDPATGAATMATQYVGDYPGSPNSQASAKGFVFSCTGVITLSVSITYGGSNYTGLRFILKKP